MLSPEEKRSLQSSEGLAPVVYVQSSCDCPSRRDDLVKALARHIRVDSYGACLNNKTMPSRIKKNRVMSERENLLTLLGKYKFVLALENAECEDYITEKLWNALEVRKLLPQLLLLLLLYLFSPVVLQLLQLSFTIAVAAATTVPVVVIAPVPDLCCCCCYIIYCCWYCCCFSTALSVAASASFAAAAAAGDLPFATATAYPSVCAAFPPPSAVVFATATVMFFDVATF